MWLEGGLPGITNFYKAVVRVYAYRSMAKELIVFTHTEELVNNTVDKRLVCSDPLFTDTYTIQILHP